MQPWNRAFHPLNPLPLLGLTALLAAPASVPRRSGLPGETTESCSSLHCPPPRTEGSATVRISTPGAAGVTLWLRREGWAAPRQVSDQDLLLAPELQVPAGPIELCAQGRYHRSRCTVVDLAPGETFAATWHLDRRPAVVHLADVPPGSRILVDGLAIGTTPLDHDLEVRARSETILRIVTPDDTHHSAFLPSLDPGEVHTLRWSHVVTEDRR